MAMTPVELSGLLKRVSNGDRAAFADIYAAVAPKLYGTVIRILRRRDVAEDVLQDVFVKIWQHAATYDAERASPVTWMSTIARNAALDAVRKRGHVPIDDAPEALQVADPAPAASVTVELSEELSRLNRCIDGLEPDRQHLVRLAYIQGLSREELAERLGHPTGTIKTWLHRSLKQLKECLGT